MYQDPESARRLVLEGNWAGNGRKKSASQALSGIRVAADAAI